MLAKILPQHFPVWFCLLRNPALFEIFPALFCLLATVNHRVAQKLPVGENIQLLDLKNANPGITGDELIVAGYCRVMPLRLIIRARGRG